MPTLKNSDEQTLHHKALTYQAMKPEKNERPRPIGIRTDITN